MRYYILFFLGLISLNTNAQMEIREIDTTHVHDSTINGIYIPKNIEECFIELSKPKYTKIKSLLLNLSEDSIGIRFSGGASFWSDWYFDNESRLTRYFTDFGIKEPNSIQNIILHTYWRKLNNIPVRFEEELQKWKNIEFLEEEAYKRKFQLDSINGIYIPKNIKECFLELDKLLSKEDIKKIKQLKDKSKTIAYHHGLGTWIRNNWGLWGGSRFQKYMEDRVEDQPDGWSGTILEFYWEWLNGINANWERFDKNAK